MRRKHDFYIGITIKNYHSKYVYIPAWTCQFELIDETDCVLKIELFSIVIIKLFNIFKKI